SIPESYPCELRPVMIHSVSGQSFLRLPAACVLSNAPLKRVMTALPRCLCISVLVLTGSGFALAQSTSALPPTGKSQSSTSQVTDSALMEPRRLMPQAKYDQAIAQLQELSPNDTGLQSLSDDIRTPHNK